MEKNSFDQNVLECMVIMNWRSPNESDCPDSRYPKILARWQKEKLKALAKFPQNVQEVARQMLRH